MVPVTPVKVKSNLAAVKGTLYDGSIDNFSYSQFSFDCLQDLSSVSLYFLGT